ncbi:MAG: hypothetical protein D6753_13990 [Planctomycetota bacterium]|nr:MAG: hypothetical protein D6753_13990 [Planctomycetota bacterium]
MPLGPLPPLWRWCLVYGSVARQALERAADRVSVNTTRTVGGESGQTIQDVPTTGNCQASMMNIVKSMAAGRITAGRGHTFHESPGTKLDDAPWTLLGCWPVHSEASRFGMLQYGRSAKRSSGWG